MKVIPSEEVVSQHCIDVSDVKIKPFKLETLFQKERFWKLNERDVKGNFTNNFKNVTQSSSWTPCGRLMEITQGWFVKCSW